MGRVDGGEDDGGGAAAALLHPFRDLQENATLVLSAFPYIYVCPEPVLVKWSFLASNGAKDAFPYLLRHGDRTRIDNLLPRTHRLWAKAGAERAGQL